MTYIYNSRLGDWSLSSLTGTNLLFLLLAMRRQNFSKFLEFSIKTKFTIKLETIDSTWNTDIWDNITLK